ncbi:hypothetical protein [Catenulispora rubra]|uniref:hypothetical protein n=1 Tax=Catenulispora rubra TaxID=280293 RepID=UPI0018920130|nr:hypothetical protein [Catenulispora rubra]
MAVHGKRRAVLEMYRRRRPQDVPAEMIEAATARRSAGDPAGACAAALVDLDVDVAAITRWHGRETARLVVEDLHHVAPDLLRWNMPRALRDGSFITNLLLRRYPDGAHLSVGSVWKQPDRLRLLVATRREGTAELPDRSSGLYHLPRAYWDARYTGEIRDLCGAGPDRIPFHSHDGRLLNDVVAGPRPDDQDDPAALTEWLTLLWDKGRTGEALAACGIELALGEKDRWPQRPWVAVERLASDARRMLDEGVFEERLSQPRPPRTPTMWVECRDEGQAGTDIELTFGPKGRVTARLHSAEPGEPRQLGAFEYRHPIDFDLLRFGLARPGELHPAVAEALFPARPAAADSRPEPEPSGPFGPSASSVSSTSSASSPPPRSLSAPTPSPIPDDDWELIERAVRGDTAGVLASLDAGADPLVRDDAGQTLLHLLPLLDHEVLMARLLAAGVDVNTVDVQRHTALHAAAVRRRGLALAGSIAREPVEDLIGRLLNAGAVDLCHERGVPCPADAPTERRRTRPTAEEIERLRAAVRRHRYQTMAEYASALYAIGKDRREVLAECFGAPFPEEFFALADHFPPPGLARSDQRCFVWRLVLPPERGGPVPPTGSTIDDHVDKAVFERDPRLVPVLPTDDHHTEYGGLVLCYRLTDLARGEPTVYGTRPRGAGRIEQLGPSLLAVLHDYHTTAADRLEALRQLTPQHPDVEKLPEHRAALRLVETLLPAGAPGVTRSEPTAPFTTPVSGPVLARLRTEASREDYRSMSRLAWALYAAGLGPREVLAECFGVAFPEELFVISDADPQKSLPGYATALPWNLAVPPERGGPLVQAWSERRSELRILAWDPDLVPLTALYGDSRMVPGATPPERVPHADRIHCYRLSELAAGRSTVFGVPRHAAEAAEGELSVELSGSSILDVIHDYVTVQLRLDEWEIRQPGSWGADSIDESDVEGSRQAAAQIEALQREVADRLGTAEQ